MTEEPGARMFGNLLEGARLLEQVARPGHDRQLGLRRHALTTLPVELQHLVVLAADKQERRCPYRVERRSGQVWSTPAADDGLNACVPLSGRHEGGRRARTRAEVSEGQAPRPLVVVCPPCRGVEAAG